MSKKRWTVGSLIPGKGSQPPKANKPLPIGMGYRKSNRLLTALPMIKVQQHGRIFQFPPQAGRSLLDGALSQNLPIDYKCKKGTCGKCKVRVIEGSEWISSPTLKEWSKLKKEWTNGYRLACQATMRKHMIKTRPIAKMDE